MRLTSRFAPAENKRPEKQARAHPKPARDGLRDAPSPAAKNLALAHHLERLIDRGVIKDYSQAARMLGVSQVRVTHLMSLRLLAPAVQDAILAGTIAPGDKQLRQLARIADWSQQIELLGTTERAQFEHLAPARAPSGSI